MKYSVLILLLGASFLIGAILGALAEDDAKGAQAFLWVVAFVTVMALGVVIAG